ncbi:MAG TPA: Clp1/GlmU family protein [Actinomycetota bacterium]|jgi:polynucleotide 5'-hydroxyl-kinase GRC3/NOL9|nr:Clp1/GlmU family protein [Actinomycetota bacterium]
MDDVEKAHADAVASLAGRPGRVFVMGGVDSGKTTFSLRLARAGLDAGHVVALVDADLGQSTIGPPTTVGLKVVREPAHLDASSPPDALAFVGGISPRGHVLPLVTGTAKLVMHAIELGARMIVVDTSGLIDGVAGQVLKLTKAELCRPHHVVALSRGGELEPIVGVLERFLSLPVMNLAVHPDIRERSVDERAANREARLAAFLGPQVYRWRVKPTVFMPSLPPIFELSELDGLLVGIDDGHGHCLGLGILEYREDALRLLTPVSEGVAALRLGSVRVAPDGKIIERVDLRSVLGTD